MQINSSYNNAYYTQKNFSADQSIKKTENVKEDEKISTYKDVRDRVWEDYLNGKIDQDTFITANAAFFTASLVEASKDRFQGNPFGEMKRIQQERLKADTSSKVKAEIYKDIYIIDNYFDVLAPGVTQEENQRINNKTKDFLFEILQDIKV
ncbi:TPA: hypothetical protein R8P54_001861 [Campylobacter coli]|nr:hypothetical protein [Campylobacter coli]